MYPAAAVVNHACSFNTVRSFSAGGAAFVLRAVRDLEIGEQVSYSYIDPYQPRRARRAQLLDAYFFECACSQCRQQTTSPLRERERGGEEDRERGDGGERGDVGKGGGQRATCTFFASAGGGEGRGGEDGWEMRGGSASADARMCAMVCGARVEHDRGEGGGGGGGYYGCQAVILLPDARLGTRFACCTDMRTLRRLQSKLISKNMNLDKRVQKYEY